MVREEHSSGYYVYTDNRLLLYLYFRSNNKTDEGVSGQRKLQIYSLASHQIVKTIDFGDGPDYDVSAVDVNERAVVVVCL